MKRWITGLTFCLLACGCGGDESDVCAEATQIAGGMVTSFCQSFTNVCCACKCYFEGKGFDASASTCVCTGPRPATYTCPTDKQAATNCVANPNDCRSDQQKMFDFMCTYGPPL